LHIVKTRLQIVMYIYIYKGKQCKNVKNEQKVVNAYGIKIIPKK